MSNIPFVMGATLPTKIESFQLIDWLPIAISFASLFLAGISIWFTFIGYQTGIPKIKLSQSTKTKTAVVIEPEWPNDVSPDRYGNRRYRVLLEVTIRNQSSNPIAISKFTLNNKFVYGPYTEAGERYDVESQSNKFKIAGGMAHRGEGTVQSFPIGKQWIKPVIHLQPFDIVKGYLFWPLYEDDLKSINLNGPNSLRVETTFKDFNFTVNLCELISRDRMLEKRHEWEKSERDL